MTIVCVILQRLINISNNKNIGIMKKAFNFVESLNERFLDYLGFPELKIFSDFVEVYFTTSNTIRSFDFLRSSESDEFRFFAQGDSICFVYTFYSHDEN